MEVEFESTHDVEERPDYLVGILRFFDLQTEALQESQFQQNLVRVD